MGPRNRQPDRTIDEVVFRPEPCRDMRRDCETIGVSGFGAHATDESSTTTTIFEYDETARLVREEESTSVSLASKHSKVVYTYNEIGLLTIVYEEGTDIGNKSHCVLF